MTYPWEGGIRLAENADFKVKCMTREQYEEEGVRGAIDRFDI